MDRADRGRHLLGLCRAALHCALDPLLDAKAGLMTRCHAGELAQALEVLLDDAGRRCAMSEAGRRLVQARFTWPAIVEALTTEYEWVIARHRTKAARETAGDAR